jgi:hypothetical protein
MLTHSRSLIGVPIKRIQTAILLERCTARDFFASFALACSEKNLLLDLFNDHCTGSAWPFIFGNDTPSNFATVGATSMERTWASFAPGFTP